MSSGVMASQVIGLTCHSQSSYLIDAEHGGVKRWQKEPPSLATCKLTPCRPIFTEQKSLDSVQFAGFCVSAPGSYVLFHP